MDNIENFQRMIIALSRIKQINLFEHTNFYSLLCRFPYEKDDGFIEDVCKLLPTKNSHAFPDEKSANCVAAFSFIFTLLAEHNYHEEELKNMIFSESEKIFLEDHLTQDENKLCALLFYLAFPEQSLKVITTKYKHEVYNHNSLPRDIQEIIEITQRLSPAHRSQVLEYARYFAEKSSSTTRRKA